MTSLFSCGVFFVRNCFSGGGIGGEDGLAPGWGGAIYYGAFSWVWMFDVSFALNQATEAGDDEFGTNLA